MGVLQGVLYKGDTGNLAYGSYNGSGLVYQMFVQGAALAFGLQISHFALRKGDG